MTGTISSQGVWDTAVPTTSFVGDTDRVGKKASLIPAALSPERTPNSAELRASDPRALEICVQPQSALCLRGLPPQSPNAAAPGATRCECAKVHVHVGLFHFKPASFKGQPDIKEGVSAGVRVSLLPPHSLTKTSGCHSAPPLPPPPSGLAGMSSIICFQCSYFPGLLTASKIYFPITRVSKMLHVNRVKGHE